MGTIVCLKILDKALIFGSVYTLEVAPTGVVTDGSIPDVLKFGFCYAHSQDGNFLRLDACVSVLAIKDRVAVAVEGVEDDIRAQVANVGNDVGKMSFS